MLISHCTFGNAKGREQEKQEIKVKEESHWVEVVPSKKGRSLPRFQAYPLQPLNAFIAWMGCC